MWLFEFLFGRREDKEWERIKKEKERINEEWRRIYEERRRLLDEIEFEKRRLLDDIEEERRRLRERQRELWDLEDRLLQKEREIRSLQREIESKDNELKFREEELRKFENKLKEREKSFDKAYEALKSGYKKLSEEKKKLKNKIREIKEREKQLEEMAKEGFVKMVPVQIKIRGQDWEKFHTVISFEVPLQYAGLIRSEIQKDLSGTEYKLTDDGFYWKFRVRAYSDKQGEQNPRWFHVLRWLEDNRVILNQEQYAVVSTTSGIAGWDPKVVQLGNEHKITHICDSITTSGFAEVEVMVGESAQKEEEDEIPF